jgi:hypothetical protein
VTAVWQLFKLYMFYSGPDPPRTPQNRPKMTGAGGPGPPQNSPTVEPRIKNDKCKPDGNHENVTCQLWGSNGKTENQDPPAAARPPGPGFSLSFGSKSGLITCSAQQYRTRLLAATKCSHMCTRPCTHACSHTHIHAYTHAPTHMRMHTHTCTWASMLACARSYAHVRDIQQHTGHTNKDKRTTTHNQP